MNWGKDDNWPYKHKMPFREFFPSAGDPNISVPDGKDGTGEIDDVEPWSTIAISEP